MIRPIALALMWLFILWGGFGLLVMAVNDRKADLADTSPFAQAFWATFGDDRRRDVLVAWATSGGAK